MLEKKRNSFSVQYLRPTIRARLLDVLLFLLSPSHEGAATKTMNKYHISIDTGAKMTTKARESSESVHGNCINVRSKQHLPLTCTAPWDEAGKRRPHNSRPCRSLYPDWQEFGQHD